MVGLSKAQIKLVMFVKMPKWVDAMKKNDLN
jgi:hypothetical protein